MYLPTDAASPKVPFYSSSLLSPSNQRRHLDSNFTNDETVSSTPRTPDPVACKLSYFLQPKESVTVFVTCRLFLLMFYLEYWLAYLLQTYSAAEGFIRGRSYNIRMDDQVLLRFSPKNSDSSYYFSDMVSTQ